MFAVLPVLLVPEEIQEYLADRRAGIWRALEGLVPRQRPRPDQLSIKPKVQLHLRQPDQGGEAREQLGADPDQARFGGSGFLSSPDKCSSLDRNNETLFVLTLYIYIWIWRQICAWEEHTLSRQQRRKVPEQPERTKRDGSGWSGCGITTTKGVFIHVERKKTIVYKTTSMFFLMMQGRLT